jgi:hypothetical protein
MKKRLLLMTSVMGLGTIVLLAQDPVLIIDEDFQTWPATEGVVSDPPEECESFGHVPGPDMYDLVYETGGSGKVTLIKYLISPECNTKRVNQGEVAENAIDVTTGFVQLTKTQEETDTIGEMWLPRLSNVTQIEFGYSCTSSDRGIRLYTSIDDGETWEGPWTADGPGIGEIIGSDTKLGEMVVLDINRDNVILKFTSGIDNDGVSQNSRIHNIKIWGGPGSHETGIAENKAPGIQAYFVKGTGLVVKGEVESAVVYDLTGKVVLRSDQAGDQILDLSGFADGTYIFRARDIQQRGYSKKFTKY